MIKIEESAQVSVNWRQRERGKKGKKKKERDWEGVKVSASTCSIEHKVWSLCQLIPH